MSGNYRKHMWPLAAVVLMIVSAGAYAQPQQTGVATRSRQGTQRVELGQSVLEKSVVSSSQTLARTGSAAIQSGAPTLRIVDADVIRDAQSGGYFATVSLKNGTEKTIPQFKVKFYRDEAERTNGSWNNAGPIEPGKSWTEASGPLALKGGETRLTIQVDPDKKLAGLEKLNLRAEINVTLKDGKIVTKNKRFMSQMSGGITGGTQRPSTMPLAISGADLKPYSEGGLFVASVALKNNGAKPLPALEIKFYRDEAERKKNSLNSAGPIEPGSTWNEHSMPFALKEGENLVTIQIDPNKKAPGFEKSDLRAEIEATIKDGKIVGKKTSIRQQSQGNSRTESKFSSYGSGSGSSFSFRSGSGSPVK